MVRNYLSEQMDELSSDFPFINRSDKIDIINMVEDYIEKNSVFHGKFMSIKSKEIDYMLKREIFLSLPANRTTDEAFRDVFKNATQAEVDEVLSEEKLDRDNYRRSYNIICEKCAEKDICLEVFKTYKK